MFLSSIMWRDAQRDDPLEKTHNDFSYPSAVYLAQSLMSLKWA